MNWENYRYDLTEAGALITEYVPGEKEGEACIPSHIRDVPVVGIGEEAFAENGEELSRIEVPPTVRHIGKGAFKTCISLTELTLHEGLERIGEDALYLTPLTELHLPNTLSQIDCPWGLGTIRWRISPHHPHFFTDGFCLYKKDGEEKELLVSFQQDERTDYRVTDGTTQIGENAFSGNTSLLRVALPPTVRTIGEAAFEGCQNLSEAALPEGLREIGNHAFSHCICLKDICLPSTVERIGAYALSDTFGWSDSLVGLEHITVAAGNPRFSADEDALFEMGESGERYIVKYFGNGLEYRVPPDVSRILPGAFRRSGLHKCFLPVSVREVAGDAFRECRGLEELELEESGTFLYVPAQPAYRKDEVTGLLRAPGGEGSQEHSGYIYDYRGYDALFPTYLNLPDQCGMACCRLRYPVLLRKDTARSYRAFIEKHFADILRCLADRQDMRRLAWLSELGFFTQDNIEESLEVFAESGSAKFTGFLLSYKKEHLGEGAFDFTL